MRIDLGLQRFEFGIFFEQLDLYTVSTRSWIRVVIWLKLSAIWVNSSFQTTGTDTSMEPSRTCFIALSSTFIRDSSFTVR